MIQAKHKNALVTGAARRIGREIALDLAAQGWTVGIHYHQSSQQAQALALQIIRSGQQAVTFQADLGLEDSYQGLIAQATEQLGPLGILINNASIFEQDDITSMTRQSWERHFEINLRAPMVLCQEYARQLPSEVQGCIVNLLDQAVWKPTARFLSYTASKTALWNLTKALALALAPRVRVNAIGPGAVLQSHRQTPEQFAAQWQSTPLRRPVPVSELCRAVNFILASSSLTGQMIALDSGAHLVGDTPAARLTPER